MAVSDTQPTDASIHRLVAGKTYRITGWARGDGECCPRYDVGGKTLWVGSVSEELQPFDVTYVHEGADVSYTPAPNQTVHRIYPAAQAFRGMSRAAKGMGISMAAAGTAFARQMKSIQEVSERATRKLAERKRVDNKFTTLAEAGMGTPPEHPHCRTSTDDMMDAMRLAFASMAPDRETQEEHDAESWERRMFHGKRNAHLKRPNKRRNR